MCTSYIPIDVIGIEGRICAYKEPLEFNISSLGFHQNDFSKKNHRSRFSYIPGIPTVIEEPTPIKKAKVRFSEANCSIISNADLNGSCDGNLSPPYPFIHKITISVSTKDC